MTEIRELKLAGNRISTLDGLDKLQELVTLDVSNNLISELKEVLKLKANKNLKNLVLSGNPIAKKR